MDPLDGSGDPAAIRALLADPRVQDPLPKSAVGARDADPAHRGDPALDTAIYKPEIGNLRADYVLPSRAFTVLGSGVHWPEAGSAALASNHRLVWVDLELR